ncbi:MAG: DUF3604 domain-containing protein [Balneolaceae bacterium]
MKKIDRKEFLTLCKSVGIISLFPFGTPLYLSHNEKSAEEKKNDLEWPGHVQENPALAIDQQGNQIIAILERELPEKKFRVFTYRENDLYEIAVIQPENITGLSEPAICSFDGKIMLAFSLEKNDRWEIAYSILDAEGKQESNSYTIIPQSSRINITPAVAADENHAYILWESSEKGKRVILGAKVDANGAGKPNRLTDANYNSNNPAVLALPNGDTFAAWDSIRNGSGDIYGAWFRNGKWENEIQLTSNIRMEKRPFLANQGNDIWMCWEAQSFDHNFSGNITEQRIIVAKWTDNRFYMPKNLFESVSPDTHNDSVNTDTPWITHYENSPRQKYNLVRPRIAFDQSGALWVTAREFMELRQSGSKPTIWKYSGEKWTERNRLLDQQGKRQPVPISFSGKYGYAVYQYDDLPITHTQIGEDINWKSGFGISELPVSEEKSELITVPLKMPETKFSLKEKMRKINLELPRQEVQYKGDTLKLYFGDLHSHSDISVCRRSWNPSVKEVFELNRDVQELDFIALTDHGYNLDAAQWDYLKEQVRNNHDEGTFVTILAQEWTSQGHPPDAPKEEQGYGHHNLLFLDPHFAHFYDAHVGDITPKKLWEQLKKDGAEFIFIPHQIADMGTNISKDWDYMDEKMQPVAEIYQGRGSYEYMNCPKQAIHGARFKGPYMQDVWERKNIIGIIASPDHWGGIGKAAVWAKDLSREGIFEAIRSRHTYGTTGTKIGLLFRSPQAIMGDKVAVSSNPEYNFQIKSQAKENIEEVVIFRNNEIVHRQVPMKKEVNIDWRDEQPLNKFSWYYTRIICEDGEIAWSSPIWFV